MAGGLATVRGITVAASLAPQLAALLDAADADGMSFAGGGYRDPQAQSDAAGELRLLELRHPGQDAVRAQPAYSPIGVVEARAGPRCRLHQQRLVDHDQEQSGFRWLTAKAGRFGLRNLPEEPWHWSTNGR